MHPSEEIQKKAVEHVRTIHARFDELLSSLREEWLRLFEATYVFRFERANRSSIAFPKCFEHLMKVAPRIVSNDPKFVMKLNVPVNLNNPAINMEQAAYYNQAALNFWWNIGNGTLNAKDFVTSALWAGISFAEVKFNQKIKKRKEKQQIVDEEGNLKLKTTEITDLIMEYPYFEAVDIFEVYFDPRITEVDDMYGFIRMQHNVRKSDILRNKELYFNLDQIKEIEGNSSHYDGERFDKFSIQGIPYADDKDPEYLTLKHYYGYFSETDDIEDEELMLITIANDSVVIRYEPIDFIPFEKFVPIRIPHQAVGKGIVEPIEPLQRMYNHLRNIRIDNVNMIINRMWMMKTGSGIDPRDVVSLPGKIIPVDDPANLQALQMPDLAGSAYNETQALNTEMQTILGTIDSTQDSGENGFTNLATGQRIRWNEFNTRFKDMKKNFEVALGRLGMKMLMLVSKRASTNPLILDEKTKQFYEMFKPAFDSVTDFYSVSVLADSTSFDSLENARDEALAKAQIASNAKAQGLPINLVPVYRNIFETFTGMNVDEILPSDAAEQMQQQPQQGSTQIPENVIDQAQVQPTPEEQLNTSLAQV